MIDLSQRIFNEMSVYPGDSQVGLKQVANLTDDGCNLYDWQTNLHAGTHVDAPFHFLATGDKINELPLENFLNQAICLDVRNQKVIEWQANFAEIIGEKTCVILWTGHDRYYGTQAYYTEQPVVSEMFVEQLVLKKVKVLGMDMASPDQFPYQAHQTLLGNGICLLENLTNLAQLPQANFQLAMFPLNIEAEASPVRAVALLENSLKNMN